MLKQNGLKPLAIAFYGLFALGFTLAQNETQANDATIIYQPVPDSPIETRNPAGPAELAQYDFLIGDWDADVSWSWPGQEPFTSKAKWHNHWIVNGMVVMLEWRGPQYTGTEIRQWNPTRNEWVGVNIYPDFSNAPNFVTSKKAGDKMFVYIPVETPDGGYLNRETYYDIKADSYKMKSEISRDDGKTWQRGYYEMTVTRSK